MSEQSDDDLEDLYERAPCGYISLFPDARIAKVNGTFARWMGLPADELVGRPLHAVLSFGGRIAYETHLAPLLRLQGFVDELALDLLHSNGSKLPVIANAAEKIAPDGRHIFTRLTLFKAVDRRSYERRLIAAREKAEFAANAELENSILREQFIAVLGHDLKNPLAALAAGIGMIKDRELLSDRGELILREMAGSVGRATALIDDVLDLARGRLGGGLVLTRDGEQPLTPVLEQVAAEIRSIAPAHRILTEFSIAEPVDCDRGRIAQLTSNLLANAVTHGAPEAPIEVVARTVEGKLIISVSNSGAVIPPEARARLFQPFFRGVVQRRQKGLGLGLFIVNEIAKAHDGEMQLSSSQERTCFTFTMPLGRE